MSNAAKTLNRILRGTSDKNIRFDDLCKLLRHLGFVERIRGGHHIFTLPGIPEILNLQPRGNQAKPYQVRQVRNAIVIHGLAETADEENETTQGATDDQERQSESENKSDEI